jgi:hypothetical protein
LAAKDDNKVASNHASDMTENTHMESSIKGRKPIIGTKEIDAVLSGRVRKTKARPKLTAGELQDLQGAAAHILKHRKADEVKMDALKMKEEVHGSALDPMEIEDELGDI